VNTNGRLWRRLFDSTGDSAGFSVHYKTDRSTRYNDINLVVVVLVVVAADV
jgi:hypothetical protein